MHLVFFFFNDTATTEIYTLSLHDALPIYVILEMLANVNLAKDLTVLAKRGRVIVVGNRGTIEINPRETMSRDADVRGMTLMRSEEHTSELQSRQYLVCRLLLEKKNTCIPI